MHILPYGRETLHVDYSVYNQRLQLAIVTHIYRHRHERRHGEENIKPLWWQGNGAFPCMTLFTKPAKSKSAQVE